MSNANQRLKNETKLGDEEVKTNKGRFEGHVGRSPRELGRTIRGRCDGKLELELKRQS